MTVSSRTALHGGIDRGCTTFEPGPPNGAGQGPVETVPSTVSPRMQDSRRRATRPIETAGREGRTQARYQADQVARQGARDVPVDFGATEDCGQASQDRAEGRARADLDNVRTVLARPVAELLLQVVVPGAGLAGRFPLVASALHVGNTPIEGWSATRRDVSLRCDGSIDL